MAVLLATGDGELDRRLAAQLPGRPAVVYYREALREAPPEQVWDVAVVSTLLPGRCSLVESVWALRDRGVRVVLVGPAPPVEELAELVALGVYDLLLGEQPVQRILEAVERPAAPGEALAVLAEAGREVAPGRLRQLASRVAAVARQKLAGALPAARTRGAGPATETVRQAGCEAEGTDVGRGAGAPGTVAPEGPGAADAGPGSRDAVAAGRPVAEGVPGGCAPGTGTGERATGWPVRLPPRRRQLVAVVEADRCGTEQHLVRWAQQLAAEGRTVALVGLDLENRCGRLLGAHGPSDPWHWQHAGRDLFLPVTDRLRVVPAPAAEAGVEPEWVGHVLQVALEEHDMVLSDLGCRWAPRLFRPVLALATAQVLVCSGTPYGYAAVERRLEQADLSGWADPQRFQLVVVAGPGAAAVPLHLRDWLAGTLAAPSSGEG